MELKLSVVIPTCNRANHLNLVLRSLKEQTFPPSEIIIVDASSSPVVVQNSFTCPLTIITSSPSVCKQRNTGIRHAVFDWILLCDDDLEFPTDYLAKLVNHIKFDPQVGAVSGKVLQKKGEVWVDQYPIQSTAQLFYRFLFQLGIWGKIEIARPNFLSNRLGKYYRDKGNHIARSGWPVITNFNGDFFKSPIYGLGAALVKKEWLLNSPYDEVLDANGIGDNYGVAIGFPTEGIHVLANTWVHHHQAFENRLDSASAHFKRVLALDYFRAKSEKIGHVNKIILLWSLAGNLAHQFFSGNWTMVTVSLKLIVIITLKSNPYLKKRRADSSE